MRVVGIIVIVLLAACVIVVRPAWVGAYQLPSYRDIDWNSVGIPGSIHDYQSVYINEDHFVDLARVMGSSVEIYLNQGGRFADEPSMVISVEDFRKATVKGSLIGSRWPYLVQKYGVRQPHLKRSGVDTSSPPRILGGPTSLEDISDTIDFAVKWRNDNLPNAWVVGFNVVDLDGDAVPEIAIMFYWADDTSGGGRLQVYKNYGEGNWQLEVDTVSVEDGTYGMVAHDFDGNGRAEIIWIHPDDSKVLEFTNINDYIVGNCTIASDFGQDWGSPLYLTYAEREPLPLVQFFLVNNYPDSCKFCRLTRVGFWSFVRRTSYNSWIFSINYPRFKSFTPVDIYDLRIGDVDNDGINEVVPAFGLWPWILRVGQDLPIFYFDNIDGFHGTYDTYYLHHGLAITPHGGVLVQDLDVDGLNELFLGGGGQEHSRENILWAPTYSVMDGIAGVSFDTLYADFRRFEEFPRIIQKRDLYGQKVLTALTDLATMNGDSSSSFLNIEFLEWGKDKFKAIYKGGWIEHRFISWDIKDFFIGDLDHDGLEDIIFWHGDWSPMIDHWEKRPFDLGLTEFSTSGDSSGVDIIISLENPRNDIGLNVYKRLSYWHQNFYMFEKVNSQPLSGDTLFTLRDNGHIPGIPYDYYLVADDYDGCPSMYGPIYGTVSGNVQEPLLGFSVEPFGLTDTLMIKWSVLFYDAQWELYRSTSDFPEYKKIGQDVFTGDTGYVYFDGGLYQGVRYYYKLHLLWPDNPEPWYGPVINTPEGGNYPDKPIIDTPYPNPFDNYTTIRITMPLAYGTGNFNDVALTLYNILGQKVRTRVFRDIPPGRSELRWDGTNNVGDKVSAGIYFYKLTVAGNNLKKGKLLLMEK